MSGSGAAAADGPRHVIVNGLSQPLPAGGSLGALLEAVGLAGRPVAVEVDGAVVPRAEFGRRLVGGERIEIVTFVGGG